MTVQTIGRWKSPFQLENGTINPEEVEIGHELMELAASFGCTNYITGCNYAESADLSTNYENAIGFFRKHMEVKPDTVRLSVYNCRKANFVNTPDAWKVVLPEVPGLGIKYDPSHTIDAGGDYLEDLVLWGDKVNHVHLKGSLVVNGRRIDDPPAGLDQTDWKSVLNILRTKGYDGGLSLEPHGKVWTAPDKKDQGIAYSIRYIRELMM